MAIRHRILAHSQQTNQKQQSMDLWDNNFLEDASYAQRMADSYADRLNQQTYLGTRDWRGSIEAYEHVDNPINYRPGE